MKISAFRFTIFLLILSALGCLVSHAANAQYVRVDFTASCNARLQDQNAPGLWLPDSIVGAVTLGGIPFYLPPSGLNFWNSSAVSGDNPRTLDLNVNLPRAAEVHTLIGSYWGQGGPTSYASLEFFGSGGAYYKKDLLGNDDIRDFNDYIYTGAINGVTTVQVFSYVGFPNDQRLDKQQVTLPVAFASQTLTKIRLSDNGADGLQRIFLAGVTVKTLPATASISGVLTFEGIASGALARSVTFLLRPSDGSGDLTQTISVPPTGEFRLSAPQKSYTLHITAPTYLASNVPVDASNGDVTGVTATLRAGDADDSNAIDIADFAILVSAYGGFAIGADFNGDGKVDIADFGLLVGNYGASGDN